MEGIRDPLVVWKQEDGTMILLDGHNRMKISAEHGGIPYRIVEKEFESRDDAKIWILQNQVGRRNIDKWVKYDLMKMLRDLITSKAKQRIIDGAKGTPILAEAKGEARDKLAEMVGVGHTTLKKMDVIDSSGNEEIKQKARSGEMTTSQAYDAIIIEQAEREGRIPQTQAQKKRQKLVEAYERHDAYDPSGVTNIAEARQDREDRQTIALEWYGRMNSALKNLYWTGALNKMELFAEIRKALTDDERERLVKRIIDARMVLDAAISELEN